MFVGIPSYRDPECLQTVVDLFSKAKCPERVFVGVCIQFKLFEDDPRTHLLLPDHHPILKNFSKNIRCIVLDSEMARGPCFARSKVQSLFKDERYYLQIDSHTRFSSMWDEKLISMLRACKSLTSGKPIITTYPNAYPCDNREDFPAINLQPLLLCADRFDSQDGMPRLKSRVVFRVPSKTLIPSLFWAAGFSFSEGSMVRECPYDSSLQCLFFGEEISMALRLFTHGYDFFAPIEPIVFHRWSRSYRPSFTELFRGSSGLELFRLRQESLAKIRQQVLDPEFMDGMGSIRSKKEFFQRVGIDLEKKTISEMAKNGGLEPSAFKNPFDELLKFLH